MNSISNVRDIEALTESEAQSIAHDTMTIKGHTVYFVNFDGFIKRTALVFADGRHIYFANEYDIHKRCPVEELKAEFIRALNGKLFTEDEITGPLTTYDEYKRKDEFLHNYYGMRRENITIFRINPTDDEQKAFERQTAGMTLDPVSFAYYSDAAFVHHHVELYHALEARLEEMMNSPAFMKSAFKYEMFNHEYAINYQGNWDVLSCFYGNVKYDVECDDGNLNFYFDQLHFSDEQRNAYLQARSECYAESDF